MFMTTHDVSMMRLALIYHIIFILGVSQTDMLWDFEKNVVQNQPFSSRGVLYGWPLVSETRLTQIMYLVRTCLPL